MKGGEGVGERDPTPATPIFSQQGKGSEGSRKGRKGKSKKASKAAAKLARETAQAEEQARAKRGLELAPAANPEFIDSEPVPVPVPVPDGNRAPAESKSHISAVGSSDGADGTLHHAVLALAGIDRG